MSNCNDEYLKWLNGPRAFGQWVDTDTAFSAAWDVQQKTIDHLNHRLEICDPDGESEDMALSGDYDDL